MSDRKLVKQLEEQSRINRQNDPRSRRARMPLLKESIEKSETNQKTVLGQTN